MHKYVYLALMPGNFSLNPVASVLNVQKAPMLMIPADVRGLFRARPL
jgi:hypothetical protein